MVPTVNLAKYDELLPANGVYISCLKIGDENFESVTNVGNRPTFGEDSFAVETHILNFTPIDLTRRLHWNLRSSIAFARRSSGPLPKLSATIMRDVAKAKRYFRRARFGVAEASR